MTQMYEACTSEIHAHRNRQEELASHVKDLVAQLQAACAAAAQATADTDAAAKAQANAHALQIVLHPRPRPYPAPAPASSRARRSVPLRSSNQLPSAKYGGPSFRHREILRVVVLDVILPDLDVPVRLVLDDGRGGFRDLVESPDFDAVGLGVVDTPRGLEILALENIDWSLATSSRYANLPREYSPAASCLGFDPARLLYDDLQRVYADTLKIFCHPFGGDRFGAVWDPTFKQPWLFQVLGWFSSVPEKEKDKDNGLAVLNEPKSWAKSNGWAVGLSLILAEEAPQAETQAMVGELDASLRAAEITASRGKSRGLAIIH
ncbi:hypothetical protein B0H11DRAFT_2377604 [Mycena galericulata]|nr:hypothetical protein B0H11DRAFT_2377604 [Mycena galericulata]